MGSRVVYQERTGWPWWVLCLFMLMFLPAVLALIELAKGNVGGGEGAMPLGEAVLLLSFGLGLPSAIFGLMGQLRTRVTDEGLDLRWGFAEVIRKKIPFGNIEGAEAVTYAPIRDFGGWGIRIGGKKKLAWTVKGNRALLLRLRDGGRFYLGSDKPERILQWVLSAKKRNGA